MWSLAPTFRRSYFLKDLNNDELRKIVETDKCIILTKYRKSTSRTNSPMAIPWAGSLPHLYIFPGRNRQSKYPSVGSPSAFFCRLNFTWPLWLFTFADFFFFTLVWFLQDINECRKYSGACQVELFTLQRFSKWCLGLNPLFQKQELLKPA